MRQAVKLLSVAATAAALSVNNVGIEIVLDFQQHASAVVEVELDHEIHTATLQVDILIWVILPFFTQPPIG